MSKTKSTQELNEHKDLALKKMESYLTELITSDDLHDNGKADKLCY